MEARQRAAMCTHADVCVAGGCVQADSLTSAKLRAAAALQLLASGKYRAAARKFVEVSPELGASYNDVLAPHDVATYGALTALATMDRSELRTRCAAAGQACGGSHVCGWGCVHACMRACDPGVACMACGPRILHACMHVRHAFALLGMWGV